MSNKPGGTKRPWRVVALVLVIALAGGLAWMFAAGMSDKEGRIKVVLALAKAREVQDAVERHFAERRNLPPNNDALRLPGNDSRPYLTAYEQQGELSYRVGVKDGVITLTFAAGQDPVSEKSLILEPRTEDVKLAWTCSAGTVEARYRPPKCRGQ